MSTPTRRAILCLSGLLLGLAFLPGANAQNEARKEFQIGAIRQQTLKAPDYSYSGGNLGSKSAWANRPWLQVEVDFDSSPDWADDVQLKFYVLMGQGRELRMFSGQLTLINVAKGRHHFAAMFVHPTTLYRFGQNKVEAVAVQLFYQGRLVDMNSDVTNRGRWWEQFTPVEGYLLAPADTPWSVVAFQRYEEAKPAGSR